MKFQLALFAVLLFAVLQTSSQIAGQTVSLQKPIVFGQPVIPATAQSTTGPSAGGDETPDVCPLHKKRMVNGSVPIRYGLIRMYTFDNSQEPEREKLVDEYARLKREQFPQTYRSANGGCDPGFLMYARSMTFYYCEMCRSLER